MPHLRQCPKCGARLPEDSPAGQCVRCLLQFGLASPLGGPSGAALPTIRLRPGEDPADEAVGQTIGHYKLLEKVGEGGCGVVYVAEQSEPVRRRVALKVIKLGMETRQVIARFEAERQALAMMDHPNIAKVLDGGATETGRPYFAMELVRGIRITDYCDQAKLTTEERLGLFAKVCQAIQHAHQKGIIHRDIKPSNILVTLHDGVPVPKVIDFGIAKAIQGRLTDHTVYTQLHQFIGTPAYMSPEQAEMSGLDIDTRSDIYSLGVLLYELLAGRTPFEVKELLEAGVDRMRQTIREQEPVRPSTRLANLPGNELTTTAKRRSADTSKLLHQIKGDLDWIVMKCLEKDRARRYETANGLARDIERHLRDEPVAARPPSQLYKFQKLLRRNKVAVSVALAVTAALLIGIAGSTWQAVRATRAETEAVQARRVEMSQRLAAQEAQQKALSAQQAERQAHLRADAEKAAADRLLYVANMNLAQQAWDQSKIGRLRQLLQEAQSFSEHGFEWYYWQRQTHLALKTLQGDLVRVCAVAFSPDGRRVATGSDRKTGIVWDATSGRELLTLSGHRSGIRSVAFSSDGLRIVTGDSDQTAKVWDAATGKDLFTLEGHSNAVRCAVFSPDGRRVVTCSGDTLAKVWDAATGRELLSIQGYGAPIYSVAFSPDGRRIITGSEDHTARVWDAATGKELLTIQGYGAPILSVAFSPDGQRIVGGGMANTAKVWNAATGKELLTLTGHGAPILSVAFSPDGLRIATGSSDFAAKVWEAGSGRELLTLKGHNDSVLSLAFSPDGRRIITGSRDHTAMIWDASCGVEPLSLKGHDGRIWCVAFSPDGRWIVTGGEDRTARVWEAVSGRQLLKTEEHRAPIQSVAFSPDGQRIVTGSGDETAMVWDVANPRRPLVLKGHNAPIQSVTFSPDGRWIATASLDQTAKVWNSISGRDRVTLKGHSAQIGSVAFSPDSRRIVTASADQTARVWEAASGKQLFVLQGHHGPLESVTFSPEGEEILAGGDDQTVRVWEVATGRERRALQGHGGSIWSVAISPDGRRVVTGSDDQTAKVWDAASGRELLALKGHSGSVWSVAFSPDGRRIVTGGEDGTALVWQAARDEEVAAWQEEDRAGEQRVAALQAEWKAEQERQRLADTDDAGSIKRWLILAPIPLPPGQSTAEGLEIEQIEDEARQRPRAGEIRAIGKREFKWREQSLPDHLIDFNTIVGRATYRCVAYAVCYLQSDAELRGLRMLVGSDDESKVYLNGKQVYEDVNARVFGIDQDVVPNLALHTGLNLLVFKVVNWVSVWKGSIRFTDAQGNPVQGIQVTLDPEPKEKTPTSKP